MQELGLSVKLAKRYQFNSLRAEMGLKNALFARRIAMLQSACII